MLHKIGLMLDHKLKVIVVQGIEKVIVVQGRHACKVEASNTTNDTKVPPTLNLVNQFG